MSLMYYYIYFLHYIPTIINVEGGKHFVNKIFLQIRYRYFLFEIALVQLSTFLDHI